MKIFGDKGSGNCLKVKYTADALGLAYQWVDVDILKGESRTPEFLAMNPNGQVPTVVLADGQALSQSNAIIRFLAHKTRLLPDDPFQQAKVDEWLFWEQNSHEAYIAGARFQRVYLGRPASAVPEATMVRGNEALDSMERHLALSPWLANAQSSIADIALFAYTQFAHEGGFDLSPRPAIRGWITRCAAEFGVH